MKAIDIERVVKIMCKTCDGTGRAQAYGSRGEPYLAKCWDLNCHDGYRFETDHERSQRQRDEWKTAALAMQKALIELEYAARALTCPSWKRRELISGAVVDSVDVWPKDLDAARLAVRKAGDLLATYPEPK